MIDFLTMKMLRNILGNGVNIIFSGKAEEYCEKNNISTTEYLDAHNLTEEQYFKIKANNPDNIRLESYLLQRGYTPLQDDVSISDKLYNTYKTRRIEEQFMPFVYAMRFDETSGLENFKFSAHDIGWICNPSEAFLGSLVPESVMYAQGKTWREYLTKPFSVNFTQEMLDTQLSYDFCKAMPTWGQCLGSRAKLGTNTFYCMSSYYNVDPVSGRGIRTTKMDQTEFWSIVESVGFGVVALDYVIEEIKAKFEYETL